MYIFSHKDSPLSFLNKRDFKQLKKAASSSSEVFADEINFQKHSSKVIMKSGRRDHRRGRNISEAEQGTSQKKLKTE